MQGEARLRGLHRIIYSKTISPRLCEAKPACAGYDGLFLQRPSALGYARRSSPARAVADYFCKDHQPAGGAHQHPYRSAFYFGYTLRSPPVRALLDLPRLPGSAGVLTGVGFLGSPVCHFPFQASGRPTPPSPRVGLRADRTYEPSDDFAHSNGLATRPPAAPGRRPPGRAGHAARPTDCAHPGR